MKKTLESYLILSKKLEKNGRFVEEVNLIACDFPSDYSCPDGIYSDPFLGELKREDGTYYSRLERRKYYCKEEKAHIAKTPLHIARWAIQNYTDENDWILDPTIGAGTTAVEAIILKRNCFGVELENNHMSIIEKNIDLNNIYEKEAIIKHDLIGKKANEICNNIWFEVGGYALSFTWRAWGDLMQAIVDKKEGYMSYY